MKKTILLILFFLSTKSLYSDVTGDKLAKLRKSFQEILHIPKDFESYREIWDKGGHRKNMRDILAKTTLSKHDLIELSNLVLKEKMLIDSKVNSIISRINKSIAQGFQAHLADIVHHEKLKQHIDEHKLDPKKIIEEEKAIYNKLLKEIQTHLN